MRRPLRVGLVSLGCPKNLVDSEVMLGLLQRSGCTIVTRPQEADVVVVNTCGFIDKAKQESIETILEMGRAREGGGAPRLVVTGCLVQRYGAELRRELPEIDALLGPGALEGIVDAVRGADVPAPDGELPTWVYDHTTPRLRSTPPHLAYVKISEGCDYRCSFCIIPKLRGHYRSRREDDIVAEAEGLAAAGVRELVLVAQDTTRYGLDLGVRNGLARLLRRLGRLEGLRWIRVMYAYPTTISDEILTAIAEEQKVAKYIDLPLQHASPEILRAMRRPFGRARLMGLLERIRRRVPGVTLRSAFIVGFPGEGTAEFAELLAFVREAALDHVGVFTYSNEEGTGAHTLGPQVPQRTKEARYRRLMALQQRLVSRRNRRRVGERVEVLVEGPHPEGAGLLVGRLASQAPEIDGNVLLEGEAASGTFVTCEVREARLYDLLARIIPSTRSSPDERRSPRASAPRRRA